MSPGEGGRAKGTQETVRAASALKRPVMLLIKTYFFYLIMVAFTIGKEKRSKPTSHQCPSRAKRHLTQAPETTKSSLMEASSSNPPHSGGTLTVMARIGSESRDKGPGAKKVPNPGPGSYALPSLVSSTLILAGHGAQMGNG